MRISDWSSDVCSSDLEAHHGEGRSARRDDLASAPLLFRPGRISCRAVRDPRGAGGRGTEWQDDEGFRNSARGRAEMIGLIRTSLRSGLRRLRSAAFMTLAAAGVAMAAPAIASAAGIDGTPGKCTEIGRAHV